MEITIASGAGAGPTELAAFDAALVAAGVANYNLIIMSSVIPPQSSIRVMGRAVLEAEWGDRLYVVMADKRVRGRGAEAWAGIGWVQDGRLGRGLFVEHTGTSRAMVERDITLSLESLVRNRGMHLGPPAMTLAGATCEQDAACALVVAVYGHAVWT